VAVIDGRGGPAGLRHVRRAQPGSYDAVFYDTGLPGFLLRLRDSSTQELREPRLQRAIGVVYRPELEDASRYFNARLAGQFDAMLYIGETRGVQPLEPGTTWNESEVPETFPSAL
jgi:erythromycin esterase-like protein